MLNSQFLVLNAQFFSLNAQFLVLIAQFCSTKGTAACGAEGTAASWSQRHGSIVVPRTEIDGAKSHLEGEKYHKFMNIWCYMKE